jgi:hypothetical protein
MQLVLAHNITANIEGLITHFFENMALDPLLHQALEL